MRAAVVLSLLTLTACGEPADTDDFALAVPVALPHIAATYPGVVPGAVTDCLLDQSNMEQLDAIAGGDTALIDEMLAGPAAACLTET